MIATGDLFVVLAILGALLLVASIPIWSWAAGCRYVGAIFFVVGIVGYVLELLFF